MNQRPIWRKATHSDLTTIQAFLMSTDSDLALYGHIKDYYLSGSSLCGIHLLEHYGCRTSLCFWSATETGLYITELVSRTTYDNSLIKSLLQLEGFDHVKNVYLATDAELTEGAHWTKLFDTQPNVLVDHPVYEVMFDRTIARKRGSVYEYHR
jgi:hypothetical protein